MESCDMKYDGIVLQGALRELSGLWNVALKRARAGTREEMRIFALIMEVSVRLLN